tara:strand:+ start:2547 stop:2795 length:249 start_codon:yes stop_codon:yes gene_type:complete
LKKVYRVTIDVTSQAWETAIAYVEAESEEQARKLFMDDPGGYDWEDWETHDSETQRWEIDTVEYDEFQTEWENKNAKVQSND